jgi:hypothetical protein
VTYLLQEHLNRVHAEHQARKELEHG